MWLNPKFFPMQLQVLPVERRAAKDRRRSMVLTMHLLCAKVSCYQVPILSSEHYRQCVFVIFFLLFSPVHSVEESHVLTDSGASANHQTAHNNDVPSKGKKQKNETDKGRSRKNKLYKLMRRTSAYIVYFYLMDLQRTRR